jgi:hypothetical protein
MQTSKQCKKTRLAECGAFSVELCDCGIVSLVIGFVTMRLEKSALAELDSAIRRGLDALSQTEPTLH